MLELAHKKLDVWISATELVKEIYSITKHFPKEEQFGLTSQLRRASVSVVSNLSEGLARYTDAEKKRFLEIARSSVVEIDAQIELSIKLDFLNKDQIQIVDELLNRTFAMLTNLIKKYS
ncbi:MAG: four helix bundle protein [Ignavibacteriales bacterium]|nr:four helix bundle protein [Ignavibacteriales bacterium]